MSKFSVMVAAMQNKTPTATLPVPEFASRLGLIPAMRAKIAASSIDYRAMPDMQRIIDIPCYSGMTQPELDAYSRMNILSQAYDNGFRFLKPQAEAIASYEAHGGLLAPIGVGFGKTLATLAIAEKAWRKGIRKIMLMLPSNVLPQLYKVDLKWARLRIPITYPIFWLGGRGLEERKTIVKQNKAGVYVYTYSLLSAKDADLIMQTVDADLMILDEAHNIARRHAARTRRISRYMENRFTQGRRADLSALSGTITSKGIHDYYHIARWALNARCPLPLAAPLAQEWANIIDAEAGKWGDPVTTTGTGPLMPLIEWARKNYPDETLPESTSGFRRAYKLRFNSCPGVVSTGDAEIGTSLIICNRPVLNYKQCEGFDLLEKLANQISDIWLTPNGDEIEHAIHCWKWLNEISGAGFYNQLTWPEPDTFSKRKSMSQDQAVDYIERSKVHHAAGQVYAKSLRRWLQDRSKPGLDTPFLVGQDFFRNQGKTVNERDLYEQWLNHRACDFEGRPDRDSKAVRVCSFKINAALEWAKETKPKGEGALFWVHHQEVGHWMYETLTNAGFDTLYAPAGANELILDPANKDKLVVASIKAHGTGKNLQHFQNQYFVQWPRPAVDAEQTIGRTHRTGQMADELSVYTNLTLEWDFMNFAATVNDSLYIQQTTGNRQKLIFSNYDPLPKMYPSTALSERGLQTKILNREQQAILDERFSSELLT